jgi:hypothetical protein
MHKSLAPQCNHRPLSPLPFMSYEITTNAGRCEAMTVSEIPAYRCTGVATADRDGHAVCAAHSRTLRIWFYDEDDAGVLHG